MKKIIVFDLDGVLVDSIDTMYNFFSENRPGVTMEMYRELFAGNYLEESKKYEHLILPRSEQEKSKRLARFIETKKKLPLFPGIKELLQELRSSDAILVLSTSTYNKTCRPLLEHAGIEKSFDFVATADVSKSKAEKFSIIGARYGVMADKMIFITDSLGDVREAATLNVPTIAVTWGVHNKTYFMREQHDNVRLIVHTVPELRSALLGNA
jgi:HAD superfamily hydrolase (TIGR01509 family)